jgi:acyl carrier protein
MVDDNSPCDLDIDPVRESMKALVLKSIEEFLGETIGRNATENLNLHEMGLDTIDIMELIMTVEAELNVEIEDDLLSTPDRDMSEMTFGEFVDLCLTHTPATVVTCPDCGQNDYLAKGRVYRFGAWYQRRKCKACGRNYYVNEENM